MGLCSQSGAKVERSAQTHGACFSTYTNRREMEAAYAYFLQALHRMTYSKQSHVLPAEQR